MSFQNCNGDICLANDKYKIDYGVRAQTSLIRYTHQKIYDRSSPSLISLRSIAKSRLSLDHFFGPPSTTIQGETPIPIFARSTPFAYSLCSLAKSRLSLDAGVSPSIDLYHIVTMHLQANETLCSAKL